MIQLLAAQRPWSVQGERVGKTAAELTSFDAQKPRAKPLKKTELLTRVVRERFESEIDAAMKRKPTHEDRLAGALRAVCALSPSLTGTLLATLRVLLKRGTLTRDLYAG